MKKMLNSLAFLVIKKPRTTKAKGPKIPHISVERNNSSKMFISCIIIRKFLLSPMPTPV